MVSSMTVFSAGLVAVLFLLIHCFWTIFNLYNRLS